MVAAAGLGLPYPEAGVVDEETLAAQVEGVAAGLPERPVVLGGCCCAHVGAVEELGRRHGRIAVVWVDAHGDLNTPDTSPSGNPWGMPLRMLVDGGAVAAEDVALVGARSLDPPEREFIAASGLHLGGADAVERALEGARAVYLALDLDAFAADELASFMPEPGGLPVGEVAELLSGVAARRAVVGAGVTGARPDEANVAPVTRLLRAAGL
jgi:arginase